MNGNTRELLRWVFGKDKKVKILLLLLSVTLSYTSSASAGFYYSNPKIAGKIVDTTGQFPPSKCKLEVEWHWSRDAYIPFSHGPSKDKILQIKIDDDGQFVIPSFRKVKISLGWGLNVTAQFNTPKGPDCAYLSGVLGSSTDDNGAQAGKHFARRMSHLYIMSGRQHIVNLRCKSGRPLADVLQEHDNRRLVLNVERSYLDTGLDSLDVKEQRIHIEANSTGSESLRAKGIVVSGRPGKLPSLQARISVKEWCGDELLFECELSDTTEDEIAKVLADIEIDDSKMEPPSPIRCLELVGQIVFRGKPYTRKSELRWKYHPNYSPSLLRFKEGKYKTNIRYNRDRKELVRMNQDEPMHEEQALRVPAFLDDDIAIDFEAMTKAAARALIEERRTIPFTVEIEKDDVSPPSITFP